MIIWALIPAHNEEAVISETIKSLKKQTIKLQRIVVIADNCSDNTAQIARSEGAEVFITKNNNNKKAGAQNQFLRTISDHEVDYLLLMDADTVVAENAIEMGIKHFENENVAAVCSKAGVQKLREHCTFIQTILYSLQKVEYGLYDSQRIATQGHIKVVAGMAALHRWQYLKDVGMFNEESITEDYYLTLLYKKLGYLVTVEIKMKAWTLVPVSVSELCRQRIRWYRGGIDALKDIGWNKGTYKDILQHFWGNIFIIILFYIYTRWIFYMVNAEKYQITYSWLTLLAILFYLYDRIYRIKNYVDNVEGKDWLIAGLLIPEIIYSRLQIVLLYISYAQAFVGTKKDS